MENKITKLKNGISASFQLITIGLLVFAIILILKQQSDISTLKSKFDEIESSLSSEIDDARRNVRIKLDEVESNLSSEIDDVKRTVRIWCD
jgi:sensor domain CHASE-containing protein